MMNLIGRWLLLLGMAVPCYAGMTTVFEDDFGNGVVANSKSVAGFWSTGLNSSIGSSNALAESGGRLVMTAGGDTNTTSGVTVYSGFSSTFNFFATTKIFSARGLTFSDNGTGFPVNSQQLRFALISSAASSYGANDAVVVLVKPNGSIRLGFKQDDPGANSDGNAVSGAYFSGLSEPYGFDLVLGPGNGTSMEYQLNVYTGSVPVTVGSVAGSFSLAKANWDSGNTTRLLLWAQEGSVSTVGHAFSAIVDQLKVVDTGNLLYNAGFEVGTTSGWGTFPAPSGPTLAVESSTVYAGTKAGRVTDRTQPYYSFRRDIDSVMTTGITYTVSIWARLGSGGDQSANLNVKLSDGNGITYPNIASGMLSSSEWRQIQDEYTFTYTEPLSEAHLYLTVASATVDVLIDEASVSIYVPPPPAGTVIIIK